MQQHVYNGHCDYQNPGELVQILLDVGNVAGVAAGVVEDLVIVFVGAALVAGTAEGLAPCCDGMVGRMGEPEAAFFEGNLGVVWAEEASLLEVVAGSGEFAVREMGLGVGEMGIGVERPGACWE